MHIIKKSMMTNKVNSRDIDVTNDQLEAWQSGTLIQDAMPNLSPDDREFLMTGITPEEWEILTEMDEEYEDYDDGYEEDEDYV